MASYVYPSKSRTCTRESTDIDCLSNAELNTFEQSIPFPSFGKVEDGAVGYLCSAVDVGRRCGGAPDTESKIKMVPDFSHLVEFIQDRNAEKRLLVKLRDIKADGKAVFFKVSEKFYLLKKDKIHFMEVTRPRG